MNQTTATNTLDIARGLIANGCSVIPIRLDGSKAPALPAGHPVLLRQRVATDAELCEWFGSRPAGLAVLGGDVSGDLDCLDFDEEADRIYPIWSEMVEQEMPGLINELVHVQTPSGGFHHWYRFDGRVPGKQLLASDPEKVGKRQVLIETRGEGNYAVVPGSHLRTHETGRPWTYLRGDLAGPIRTVNVDERDCLLRIARIFDRRQQVAKGSAERVNGLDSPLVGDVFDLTGWTWQEILEPHGWVMVCDRGGYQTFRRPGKDRGISATAGHCKGKRGESLLRVFTSSSVLSEGAWGKFRAYATLNHNGDLSAAARDLAGRGFGTPRKDSTKIQQGLNGQQHHEGNGKHQKEPEKQKRTKADLVRLVDLDSLGAKLEWIWPQWILCSSLCLLAADAGKGKTRFSGDLVRRIVHGLPWPDGQPMTLPQDTYVLWIPADHQFAEVNQICKDYGLGPNVVLNSWRDNPFGGTSLDSPEDLDNLVEHIEVSEAKIVIVDTLGNATDRDLCSQHEAKALAVPLMRIAAEKKVVILMPYHNNLAGKPLGRRMVERCRTCLGIEVPVGMPEGIFNVKVTKTFAPTPPPLQGTMQVGGVDYVPAPAMPVQAGGVLDAEAVKAADWIMGKLRECGSRWAVWGLQQAAEKEGMTKGAFYRGRDALLAKGDIRQEEEGTGGHLRKYISIQVDIEEEECEINIPL